MRRSPSPFAVFTTDELLQRMHQVARQGRPRRWYGRHRLGCGCGPCQAAQIGAEEEPGYLDRVSAWMETKVNQARQVLVTDTGKSLGQAYSSLKTISADVRDTALTTLSTAGTTAAQTVGQMGLELADRVSQAGELLMTRFGEGARSWMENVGDGWEGILGMSFGTYVLLAGGALLLLAGGGGYLLTTGGGQAALMGTGRLLGGTGAAVAKAL